MMGVQAKNERKTATEKLAKGDFSGAGIIVRYMACADGCGVDNTTYLKKRKRAVGIAEGEFVLSGAWCCQGQSLRWIVWYGRTIRE